MTAAADILAEVSARYGLPVAEGATVQRIATGVSGIPLPVWDAGKGALIIPDWKEQKAKLHRVAVRAGRARSRALKAEDDARVRQLRDMHAAGHRTAAMAGALGISEGYCQSMLSRLGLKVERLPPAIPPEVQSRIALIQALAAEGKSQDAISAALGYKRVDYLRQFVRRHLPGLRIPTAPRRKAGSGRGGATGGHAARREAALAQIRALVAEGADMARIGEATGIVNVRRLRRRIREAVPDFFGDAGAVHEIDRKAAELFVDHSYSQISALLGLTHGRVVSAIRRARKAGLVSEDVTRSERFRRRSADHHAAVQGRVLTLHRDGATVDVIAAEVGLTRASVARSLRGWGEVPRYPAAARSARQARVARFHALVAEGLDGPVIAERLGMTLRAVHSLASRQNVSLRDNQPKVAPRVVARRELVRHMILRGDTQAEMLAVLKLNKTTLAADIEAIGMKGQSAFAKARAARKAVAA